MRQVVCSACGSNSLKEEGRFFVCEYCGTRFAKEQGEHGAASTDSTSAIEDMLKRADMYWRHSRFAQARDLYRKVLELDANCDIARERV